jgi:hypothetical protein
MVITVYPITTKTAPPCIQLGVRHQEAGLSGAADFAVVEAYISIDHARRLARDLLAVCEELDPPSDDRGEAAAIAASAAEVSWRSRTSEAFDRR